MADVSDDDGVFVGDVGGIASFVDIAGVTDVAGIVGVVSGVGFLKDATRVDGTTLIKDIAGVEEDTVVLEDIAGAADERVVLANTAGVGEAALAGDGGAADQVPFANSISGVLDKAALGDDNIGVADEIVVGAANRILEDITDAAVDAVVVGAGVDAEGVTCFLVVDEDVTSNDLGAPEARAVIAEAFCWRCG
ncbi:hypothetical protein BGZ58_011314 [Dissophora ornata]|nr:hypothetical protein BGZ58_011314 [Dissophora ornata]